jgi:outer membrane protein OmpA-like peptidoglycan-associated protein
VKSSESLVQDKHTNTLSATAPDPIELQSDTSIIEITRLKHDSSIVLNQIFFEFDESILLPESYNELDRLFEQLQFHRDLAIVIEGHTDNLGTFEYNIKLSLDRAQAVANHLLERGLAAERLKYEGFGYTRPLSDNRTEDGRQMNRRVAFRITDSIQKQK